MLFTAGGVATPADAALMMQLGADGVFVGSGIFKSGNPAAACRRDRQGDHVLRRPRRDRRGVARTRRGHGRHQRRRPPRAAPPRRAWLVALGLRPLAQVGVLALQGDFREHLAVLRELGRGCRAGAPRRASSTEVAGLVIPGGESSVMDKLVAPFGLAEPLKARIADGMPVYGTCAGLIMLADTVLDAINGQQSLGGLDIAVRRNAFGNQLDSFETDLDIPELGEPPVHAVFIRAPVVETVGDGVDGARGPRRTGASSRSSRATCWAPRSTPR